jgi:hypothetical protein
MRLWHGGSVAFGPLLAWRLPLREMPINRVLHEMGVQATSRDEFVAIGLENYGGLE